jgi:hypothetical protein
MTHLVVFELCFGWCKGAQYDLIDHLRCALSKENMTMKLNSFGVNGVVVFQGICSGVIMKIQKKMHHTW